jgi:hypothetical protein
MLFFGKVRINVSKLAELGQKLQNGELDLSLTKSTYCLQDDPSVGLNIWEADSLEDLEQRLAPHKVYYAEVSDVTPVILPTEAQKLLMEQLAGA